MVEVGINAMLLEMISFKNEKGKLIDKKVIYEGRPTLCTYSKKYGHSKDVCRKKEKTKDKSSTNGETNTGKPEQIAAKRVQQRR